MPRTVVFHEAPIGLAARFHAAVAFVAAVVVDTIKLRAKMAKSFNTAE